MSTPYEIRRAAGMVHAEGLMISKARDRCQGYVDDSKSWWTSDAGSAFREEFRETNQDLNRCLNKLSNLESAVERLANQVQRADDERRQAEELRRLEEQRRAAAARKAK